MKHRSVSPVSASLFRRFAAGMMLVALIALSLIPAGFMPSFTPDGKVAIVICSGVESKTILVDADMAPPGSPHEQGDQSCPYFMAQAGAALPSVFAFIDMPVVADSTALPPQDIVLSHSLHALPPVRGPPAVTTL